MWFILLQGRLPTVLHLHGGDVEGHISGQRCNQREELVITAKTELVPLSDVKFCPIKGFEFGRHWQWNEGGCMKVCDSQSGRVDLTTLCQQPAYMKEPKVSAVVWKKGPSHNRKKGVNVNAPREVNSSSWCLHTKSPQVTLCIESVIYFILFLK